MFDFDVRDRGKGEPAEQRWYWEEDDDGVNSGVSSEVSSDDDGLGEDEGTKQSLWEAEVEAMVERMGGREAAEGLWAAAGLLAMEDGALGSEW